MNNFSQTQLSNFMTAAGLVAFLLAQFDIIFPQDKIAFILAALWSLGWSGYNFYQRYSKGDLTLSGFRQ